MSHCTRGGYYGTRAEYHALRLTLFCPYTPGSLDPHLGFRVFRRARETRVAP